jgi:hypothetical protein
MKRLKVCLINPKFEPSYWGFDALSRQHQIYHDHGSLAASCHRGCQTARIRGIVVKRFGQDVSGDLKDGRYRSAKLIPVLEKVDEAFWEKFQVVSSGRELDVQTCYQK